MTVVEQARWWQELDNLHDDQGEPLTEASHRDCPGHAALVLQQWARDLDADGGYRAAAATTWICFDPQVHGHAGQYPGAPAPVGGASAEDSEADAEAAADRARAGRRRVIANNRSWRSAETVRRQWLAQFLARKSPPKGALRFLLGEFARGHWALCQSLGAGSQVAAELLGVDGCTGIAVALAAASDQRAQVIGLALVLGAYEEHTSTETWRTPKDCDRRYLAVLAEWGYQLSDVEQLVTGELGE